MLHIHISTEKHRTLNDCYQQTSQHREDRDRKLEPQTTCDKTRKKENRQSHKDGRDTKAAWVRQAEI
jgi:hypothetical protein